VQERVRDGRIFVVVGTVQAGALTAIVHAAADQSRVRVSVQERGQNVNCAGKNNRCSEE
jgi:hypothetical protein